MAFDSKKSSETKPSNAIKDTTPPHWGISLWLGLVSLAILPLGFISGYLLFLLVPSLLLFFLSLVRPKKASLPERLDKAGLGIKPPEEEEPENFWSKRTFND